MSSDVERPPHRARTIELPWWLLATLLLGLLILWAIVSDAGYAAIFRALAGG